MQRTPPEVAHAAFSPAERDKICDEAGNGRRQGPIAQAQWEERHTRIAEVAGSNPIRSTNCIRKHVRGSTPMKYAVVIERGATSYGAHVPDLPGCVAVAETKAEVCGLIREAIELYLEALEEVGRPGTAGSRDSA